MFLVLYSVSSQERRTAMIEKVADSHPKLNLLFCVIGDIDDSLRVAMQRLIDGLATSRSWVLAPPEFVDENEDPSDLEPDEDPLETLGGVLQLYSTFPPLEIPKEVDLAQLRDVEATISALQDFSKVHGVSLEFFFQNESVGEIENGKLDVGLAEGL